MTERLVHWTDDPDLTLEDRWADQGEESYDKPRGFWFSVETGSEDGWRDWCRDNEFRTDRFEYEYEVTLAPDARVLRLASADDLDAFTTAYKMRQPWQRDSDFLYAIDWRRVKDLYQAIVIAPYIWERRLTPRTSWYYTWDAASGVVWDLAAVASLTPVPIDSQP